MLTQSIRMGDTVSVACGGQKRGPRESQTLTSPNAISGTVASMYSRTNLPATANTVWLSVHVRQMVKIHFNARRIMMICPGGLCMNHTVKTARIPDCNVSMLSVFEAQVARGYWPRRTVAFDIVESPAIKADVSPQERQPRRDVLSDPLLQVTQPTHISRHLLEQVSCPSTCLHVVA